MHEIITVMRIAAPPERVWRVLLDFDRYPDWNPFIRSVAGPAAAGARMTVTIRPPGGKEMSFRPVVLRREQARELRWKGNLVVPGLFDGEHYFVLEGAAGGSTRLVHGERFSGLLVPLLRRALEKSTRAGFEAMNAALRQQVERGA